MPKMTWTKPSKVNIPLHNPTTKYYDLLVQEGDRVNIGQPIAHRYAAELKIPVFASISGIFKEIKSMEIINGIQMDHAVIENDYESTKVDRNKLTRRSAKELRDHIVNMGIGGQYQNGMQTPLAFDESIQHVVINAVYQNQAFTKQTIAVFEDSFAKIVAGAALLGQASDAPVTILTNQAELKALAEQDGISVQWVKPVAHKAWEYQALKAIAKRKVPFNPLEIGVLFTTSSVAKAVYDAVEEGIPYTQVEVHLMSDEDVTVIDVPVGTSLTDVLGQLNKSATSSDQWFSGSVLYGSPYKTDQFVVSDQSFDIGVTKNVITEDVCIKCGLCNDACPVGILPQNIMDAEIREVEDRIYDYKVDQCVECGLCSYVCPSEINVLEWQRRAKRRVARGVE
jgi:Na+-translocating ferredoxin:NAD+ oxidoreductase subunit C